MQCTECNSDNVQRLSVIYESGTQQINTTSNSIGSSVGVGRGFGLGVGSATTKTKGTSQSYLAGKAAPPKKKSFIPALVITGIGVVGYAIDFLNIIVVLLPVALSAFLAYRAFNV